MLKGLALLFIILISTPLMLAALPAFPGAEGFGAQTVGGRGGKVYIVTNTNSSGAGSFSSALMAAEPRIIVFRVSGVITSNGPVYGAWEVRGPQSNFTIAGQTSPGGITLVGGYESFWYNYANPMHDMIIRFVRFRSGNVANHGLMMAEVNNLMIDHCDFSGGTDECLDLCHAYDVTVEWSTICNSSTSGQTYGLLMAYPPTYNISLSHLLMSNHKNRGPHMHWGSDANAVPPNNGLTDYRNNICYNFGDLSFNTYVSTQKANMNIVGNYFKEGPNSAKFLGQVQLGGVTAYETDNVMMPKGGSANRSQMAGCVSAKTATPFTTAAVTTHTADNAYQVVLDSVGAWPRDAMNVRSVSEVRNGTGQFGKQDDAKITTGPAAPPDADNDGMPDCWESANGLNPNDAADNIKDKFGNGYNNIEEYINDVALIQMGRTPIHTPCQSVVETYDKTGNLSWLSISPNPCAGTGTIALSIPFLKDKNNNNIQMLDGQGRVISNLKASKMSRVNLGNEGKRLTPGIYFIRWTEEGKLRGLKKLIVM